MGKTHFSGIEIGDPSVGIFSSVPQVQKVNLTGNSPVFGRLSFTDNTLIQQIVVMDNTGALPGTVTIKIGTSQGGTGIFTGATAAGTPLAVWKVAGAGQPYIEVTGVSAPTLPVDVMVFFVNR